MQYQKPVLFVEPALDAVMNVSKDGGPIDNLQPIMHSTSSAYAADE